MAENVRKTPSIIPLVSRLWPASRDCTMEPLLDFDGVQAGSGLDARGREIPDPVPMAPPVGYSSGPSFADFVRRTIRQEVSALAADQGFETFAEAEDFDIEDDPLDPHTAYEAVFDPPPPAPPAPPPQNATPTGQGEPVVAPAPTGVVPPSPSSEGPSATSPAAAK